MDGWRWRAVVTISSERSVFSAARSEYGPQKLDRAMGTRVTSFQTADFMTNA
jgi:hypothetical protein